MAISVVRPVPAQFPISGEYLQDWGYWSPDHPHLGVDFQCPTGTDVVSATIQAKVHAVYRKGDGWGDGSFGTCVIMDVIGTPWYYIYAHLSAVLVTEDEEVMPGDVIARSGATGNVTGPHLHVQVCKNPDFPRNVDIMGDPILGIRNLQPPPPPDPGYVPSNTDLAISINSLNSAVIVIRDDGIARDKALDARLSAIERGIQALVDALPKG